MSPTHRHTILSMMKDEGPALVEWVAYHRHVGFDNICVYTNDCTDGTDAMLGRLEEMGWVRHFRNDVPEGRKPQPNALSLAGENPAVMDSEWILVMDADEFLSVKCGRGRITDLVERMPPEAQAMAVTWRCFGSSGIAEWNPGLAIETYTRAAPDDFRKGWGVKTLFRPYPGVKLGIHRPGIHKARVEANARTLYDQLWVNGSGRPMPDDFSLSGWRSTRPTLGYRLAEMNHYAVKSFEAYLLRRLRGNVNNKPAKYDAAYFALFDRNETEARNALRHARGTRKKMAEILSDPVMRRLQDEALAHHEARVAGLRASGDYDRWMDELRQAAATPIDRLDDVLFTQHLPRAWQDKVRQLQAAGMPDRTIARMIAAAQTARKGDTRAELRKAAGLPATATAAADNDATDAGEASRPDEPPAADADAAEAAAPGTAPRSRGRS